MTYNEGLTLLADRAKFARWFLWASIVIALFAIPPLIMSDYLLSPDFFSPMAVGIAALGYVVLLFCAFVACVVTIPLWTYRAWANLHILGLAGLRRSAGWAAASYFIPVVNLFVPFLAMRELYNRSMGEDEDRANASAADVTSWWACFIASTFVQLFIAAVTLFNMNGTVFVVTNPFVDYALLISINLLIIGGSWFLIRTIRDITVAQSSSAGISETFA